MPKLIQIVALDLQGSVLRYSSYQSLSEENEEIRLLNVLPSENDSVIKCTMFTTSLRSHPTFTALSYVWGDPSFHDKIIVNNEAVSVTRNLASALRQIRNTYSPEIVTIWVDALSINQEDKAEKSRQVQFMKQIYIRASLVIGFLGEHMDDSTYAIDLLHRIAHEISVEQNTRLDGPGDERDEPSEGQESWLERIPELRNFHLEDDDFRIHRAISSLFRRPYWKRVWIRQEIILAQDIRFLVGNDSITWDILARAIKPFGGTGYADSISENPLARQWARHSYTGHLFIRSIELTRETRLSVFGNPIISLLNVVVLARGSEASNPLDYIYGLLGLVDSDIIVDYESTSPEDSYTDFSRRAIEHQVSEGFSPLYNAGVGYLRQFPSLPSWAIDLSTIGKTGNRWNSAYKAAGGTLKSTAEPIIHENKLQIKVDFLDSIAKIVQVKEKKMSPSGLASVLIGLFELGDEPMEFLWRFFWTMVVGTLDELKLPLQVESPPCQDLYDAFIFLLWYVLELSGSKAQTQGLKAEIWARFVRCKSRYLGGTEEILAFLDPFFNRISLTFADTIVFFRTEKGYIGLGMPATQRKSNVCIMPGYGYPLLLRNSGEFFQLVSTCYIPGLMNGEAVGNDPEAWVASLPKIEII